MATPKITSRRKTLYYKSVAYVGKAVPQQPLSVLLQQALAQAAEAKARHMQLGEDKGERVINNTRSVGKMVACNLAHFTEGNHALVIALEEGVPEYKLEDYAPPDTVRQFLESMLFFGAHGDHVIVAASSAIRVSHLEDYLSWLLTERTGILERGMRVLLEDRRTGKGRDQRVQGAKQFTVTVPLSVDEVARGPDPDKPAWRQRLVQAARVFSPTSDEKLTVLSARDAVTEERLEVALTVKRVGRVRDLGPAMLDEMVHMVRNEEDVPFVIDVPKVGRLTGRQLRLSATKWVEHSNGNPTLRGMADAMYGWLMELVNANEIKL